MKISTNLSALKESGPYRRVQVLGEAELTSNYLYCENFHDLPALLPSLDELHIVEVNPSENDGFLYNHLSITNLELVMQFDQNLYQTLPGFQPSKAVEVKKLAHTKLGHGSKNYATFGYKIKIYLKTITPQEQSKLNYTLKNIFPVVNISIIGSNLQHLGTKFALETIVPSCEKSKCLLAKSINFDDPYDTYEYLNLAIINSDLIVRKLDEYISSYECPFQGELETYNKISWSGNMISATTLIEGLKDWRLISAFTKKTHIIAYKDKDVMTVIKVSI